MAKRGRKPKSRSSYYGSGGYSSGWGWYPRSSKPLIEPGTGIRGNRNYGTTWWGQQWLNAFNQISVDVKAYVQTVPGQQHAVGRELRKRVRNALEAQGIKLPYMPVAGD